MLRVIQVYALKYYENVVELFYKQEDAEAEERALRYGSATSSRHVQRVFALLDDETGWAFPLVPLGNPPMEIK